MFKGLKKYKADRRVNIKRVIAMMLAFIVLSGEIPVYAESMNADTGVKKQIIAEGRYTNWDGVTNVAQFKGADGNLCFAIDGKNKVTVYKTSAEGKVTGSVELTKQHSIFGTVIADTEGNFYLVSGEKNTSSDTDKETIFVSKYDSNGDHIKTVGDNGSSSASYYPTDFYTKIPFEAGNCDAAICGGVLAVNYGRKMYSDHQSNSLFAVNIADMSKADAGEFYESHSFAQRAISNGSSMIFASEGDCYDRGFVIYTLGTGGNGTKPGVERKIFDFWVEKGAFDAYDMYKVNNNFAHMGGLAALSNGNVAFAASSVRSLSESAKSEREDIFIQIFDPTKNLETEEAYITTGKRSGVAGNNGDESVTNYGVKWLTSLSSGQKAENVQIVSTDDDKLVILYEYTSSSAYKGVYYMILDSNGNVVNDSTLYSKDAMLNPCETPVFANGAVCWVGNKSGDSTNAIYMYTLDPESGSASSVTDISQCIITDIAEQPYTGSQIKPEITITDNDYTLVKDTDYTLAYRNNVNAGTAYIDIKGKGNYTGEKTVTFNIMPLDISGKELITSAVMDQNYTGKEIKPEIKVYYGDMSKKLTVDKDYKLSYLNNIEPGEANIVINGMGNYTGEKRVAFNIKNVSAPAAHSPFDPVPLITENTTEIYLVKGQKFTLPDTGWSSDKRYLSISKKNIFVAKKQTEEAIKLTREDKSIDVYISKPKILSKNITMQAGDSIQMSTKFIHDEHLDIYWHSSTPDVAKISQEGELTGCSAGNTVITAYINGVVYTFKIKVKEASPVTERSIHLNEYSTKKISIKGLKGAKWTSEDENVAIVEKSKIKCFAAGETTLSTEVDGQKYIIRLFVENVKLTEGVTAAGKNKYKVSMESGKTETLNFTWMDQKVLFKSNKAYIAYVDENMNIHAVSPGVAKITAKINGKTIGITVNVK